MIRTYATDAAGFSAAYAIAESKHIWIDGLRIVVYTGADIPPPPAPEPRMISEDEAIAAIKRIAPATTDRQAKDAIDAERTTLAAESEDVLR